MDNRDGDNLTPSEYDYDKRRPVTETTHQNQGISLPALQRLLGHDHLATTEIYLNLSPEHVIQEFLAKW